MEGAPLVRCFGVQICMRCPGSCPKYPSQASLNSPCPAARRAGRTRPLLLATVFIAALLLLALFLLFPPPVGAQTPPSDNADLSALSVAGVVAAPTLVHFALHPEHFIARSRPIWLLSPQNS